MNYRGDIRLGATLDFKFTTRNFSTGAPFTFAGSPTLAAYVGNSTTEITAGITLTVDFDARTGNNHVRVVASSGNGFATATDVQIVITAGTVNGVSVVGETVAEFSIENRSALMPTVAGRTADVSAGGEVGIDLANVGSPTTVLALTGTTIAPTQKVDIETIKTQAVTAAAGVTIPASIASPTNITAGAITTVTTVNGLAANAVTAAALATDASAEISAQVAADLATAHGAGSWATATGFATVNPDNAGIAAIKAKTDSLTFTKAGEVDANAQSINGVTLVGDGAGTPMDHA